MILLDAGHGHLSLAGGAGLIILGLTDRDTEDLGAFAARLTEDTFAITDRVSAAFRAAGYEVVDVSPSPEGSLRRLMVTPPGGGAVKVEIGVDYRARPTLDTRVGPVLDPLELGANKVLTVYADPTRGRDADDIARLCSRYAFDDLMRLVDLKESTPVDRRVLAEMFRALAAVQDPRFEVREPVREFMRNIASHLDGDLLLGPSLYTGVV
ncbi:hypothetical protein HH308_18695 [Gordonia sp. TBRC 11910]|uniref:Nucleotidyl transferase AbiEii toxin, Type IV TA system n=1 Tax=Gordonia asplenii TaxID=2725283 RepID=A0A848KYM8_9ACTN|nr:hypothetical protein [Gordonia asplenii]NMO03247.1 hypothetical protein [Gordonia asplenii]